MRKLYSLWNESGDFLRCEYHSEGEQPENSSELLPDGFIKPKLAAGVIVEDASLEDVSIVSNEIIHEITETVDFLTTRALASSIGKKGSRSYLESQKVIYQEKYNVAKGVTENENMVQTITDEMNRDYLTDASLNEVLTTYGIDTTGTKLERFYRFIIFRFELGLSFYQFFISLVEDFRTCSLTHVEKGMFNKSRTVISMAKALPEEITHAELIAKRAEMLAV